MEKLKKILGDLDAWFARAWARIKNTKAWQAAAAFIRKWGLLLFGLAAVLAVTAVIALGALNRVDKWVQDALFQKKSVATTSIRVVGIDEDTLDADALGPYNTWDRNVIAKALETLAGDPDHLPAAVVLDVLFAGNSRDAAADERLASAAAQLDCVITASIADFGQEITWEDSRAVSINANAIKRYEEPYDALKQATTQGHINVMADKDGVLRHALMYVEPNGERVYSLSYQAAKMYLEKQGKTLEEPPVNATGHFYVNYTNGPGNYDDFNFLALYGGYQKGMSSLWADKIILIGPFASAMGDAYFTSIDKGQKMHGVEFHANVIQSLIQGTVKKEAADQPQIIALFLVCLAAMALFLRLKVLPGIAVCLALMGLGFFVPIWLYRAGYVTHVLWVPAAMLILFLLAMAEHYHRTTNEKHALALKMERIDTELALATRIQANALPKTFPPFPDRTEFDLFASMTPAKEVGGDLYDFFLIDEDHLALVIGDVSGKGVPAALFMMLSITLIHHVAMREKDPAAILQAVNAEICSRNHEEMFVTVWLGVLEISTGRLFCANAGHEYPALREPGGSFDLL